MLNAGKVPDYQLSSVENALSGLDFSLANKSSFCYLHQVRGNTKECNKILRVNSIEHQCSEMRSAIQMGHVLSLSPMQLLSDDFNAIKKSANDSQALLRICLRLDKAFEVDLNSWDRTSQNAHEFDERLTIADKKLKLLRQDTGLSSDAGCIETNYALLVKLAKLMGLACAHEQGKANPMIELVGVHQEKSEINPDDSLLQMSKTMKISERLASHENILTARANQNIKKGYDHRFSFIAFNDEDIAFNFKNITINRGESGVGPSLIGDSKQSLTYNFYTLSGKKPDSVSDKVWVKFKKIQSTENAVTFADKITMHPMSDSYDAYHKRYQRVDLMQIIVLAQVLSKVNNEVDRFEYAGHATGFPMTVLEANDKFGYGYGDQAIVELFPLEAVARIRNNSIFNLINNVRIFSELEEVITHEPKGVVSSELVAKMGCMLNDIRYILNEFNSILPDNVSYTLNKLCDAPLSAAGVVLVKGILHDSIDSLTRFSTQLDKTLYHASQITIAEHRGVGIATKALINMLASSVGHYKSVFNRLESDLLIGGGHIYLFYGFSLYCIDENASHASILSIKPALDDMYKHGLTPAEAMRNVQKGSDKFLRSGGMLGSASDGTRTFAEFAHDKHTLEFLLKKLTVFRRMYVRNKIDSEYMTRDDEFETQRVKKCIESFPKSHIAPTQDLISSVFFVSEKKIAEYLSCFLQEFVDLSKQNKVEEAFEVINYLVECCSIRSKAVNLLDIKVGAADRKELIVRLFDEVKTLSSKIKNGNDKDNTVYFSRYVSYDDPDVSNILEIYKSLSK